MQVVMGRRFRMVKNIAREFDLAVQKKNVFYYLLGVVIVCVLGNIAVIAFRSIYGNNEGTYGYNILEYATWSFILPYLSCICIADTTFGSTHPNLLVKDGLTSDLSKKQIYLSKLFAAFILALTYVMFCIVVFLGEISMKKVAVKVYSQRSLAENIFDLWLETDLALEAKAGQFLLLPNSTITVSSVISITTP